MYVFKPLTEITWPVVIHEPLDGGKFNNVTVNIRYKRYTSTEQEQLISTCKNVGDLLKAVIVGWGENDFGRQDGTAIQCSPQAIDEITERDYVCRALKQGFYNANAGILEKN